jgi:hypothetical protein
VYSYAKYEPDIPNSPADGIEWAAMNYGAWDVVSFGMFPQCSLQNSDQLYRLQLGHITAMVARDRPAKWGIGEVFIQPESYQQCGVTPEQFTTLEPDLYQALLTRLSALSPRPGGLWVDYYLIKNPLSHQRIAGYWSGL